MGSSLTPNGAPKVRPIWGTDNQGYVLRRSKDLTPRGLRVPDEDLDTWWAFVAGGKKV